MVLTGLPIFGESVAMMPEQSEVALDGEIRLTLLNEALSEFKHKNNRTYTVGIVLYRGRK